MQKETKRKLYLSHRKESLKQDCSKKQKKDHNIIIKRSIKQEDILFININAPNIGAH